MNRTNQAAAAFLAIAAAVAPSRADVIEEARALLDRGEYAEALALTEAELAARPKSASAGTVNALAGEAQYMLGNRDEAEAFLAKARARGVADAYRLSGRMAMEDYDFPTASEMYSRYISLKEKASKPIDGDALREKKGVEAARDMLERVERIVVIDRIDTDHEDFFSRYGLSAESGRLRPVEDITADYPSYSEIETAESPVFENERGDFRLWAQPDSASGKLRIMESNRFIGGGWEAPMASDTVLNGGGNAAFPFMMADGTTLYFASDGDGSIGGYDIFRSNRDSETAEYQAPVNMGMPYNSPANDYMLAIDESAGIGWWATDRNDLPEGQISIYVFVPNELRRNYDVDTPEIGSLARLDDIEATQRDADPDLLEELRGRIDASADVPAESPRLFDFPIAAGTVYHNFDDFRSARAEQLMHRWLELQKEYDTMTDELAELRRSYSSRRGDRELSRKILDLEDRCEHAREALNRTRGEIVAAEKAEKE